MRLRESDAAMSWPASPPPPHPPYVLLRCPPHTQRLLQAALTVPIDCPIIVLET